MTNDKNNIDIKSVAEEVATHFKKNDLIFSVRPVNMLNKPGIIRRMLLNIVWGKCTEILNTQEPEKDPLIAEKAISVLMKRGAIVDRIICKKESFRIKLENSQYRVFKNLPEGLIYSCPWPRENVYVIKTSGERFADFIEQFDAAIPEIVSYIPDIIKTLRKLELDEMTKRTEEEFKRSVLQSLIKQFLEPLGLSIEYCLKEGDVVSIDIKKNLSAHLEMPLEQMILAIKDTDAIQAMLKPHRSIDKDSIILH